LPSAQKRKAYVVVDQFQKEFSLVSWGKDTIGKRHDFPVTSSIDFLPFQRSDGVDEDGYVFATAVRTFSDPSGGGYAGLFAHGVRVPVVVSVTGAVKNMQPRAKILAGTVASAAVTFLGTYDNYDAFTVKYDQKLTIEANGGGSSVTSAMMHLVGLLEATGYISK
jgi:hypothetical protein